MKNVILITIVFLSPFFCMGQIVLDQTDLPNIGDIETVLQVGSVQGAALSPGASGADVIWDFSSLVPTGDYDTLYYVNPSTTLYASSFPTANISIRNWESGENCNGFEYYIKSSTGMQWLGMGNCWNTPPEIFVLGNFMSFPLLSYGSSVNHSGRAIFDVISSDTYTAYSFTEVSTADGWGTITTPVGTVDAIRVYTVETAYDSSYVSGVGTQNSVVTGNYYYRWYEKDLGWPVLEIGKGLMMDDNEQTARYSGTLATNINTIAGTDNSLSLYPNPNNGVFSISLKNAVGISEVEIYNALGEKVYATSSFKLQTTNEIDISASPKGIYFVKINDGTRVYDRKIVVQ